MKEENRLRGKRARASGQRFEAKLRSFLESEGYVIDRWTNNVDLVLGKIVPAKSRFGMRSTGFPDFIAFKPGNVPIGVESKANKYLDSTERKKVKFYLDKGIFPKILVGYKGKKRGEINFEEYVSVENVKEIVRNGGKENGNG